MKNKSKVLFYVVFMVAMFMLFFGMFSSGSDLTYAELKNLFADKKVTYFEISDRTITVTINQVINNKNQLTAELPDVDRFWDEMGDTIEAQRYNKETNPDGVIKGYDWVQSDGPSAYSLIIPLVLTGLILLVLWVIFAGRPSGGKRLPVSACFAVLQRPFASGWHCFPAFRAGS